MASIFLPFGDDVEDICGKEELVTFSDVPIAYPPDSHVTVHYHLGPHVQTSPSDWLGIFPHQWHDLSRPLAHISAPYSADRRRGTVRKRSVTFSAAAVEPLESKDDSYQFVYVDANRHVLGVSSSFKITQPRINDTRNTAPLLAVNGERDSGAESGSESPAILSLASSEDEEEDWDLAQQSITLRQSVHVCDGSVAAGSPTVSGRSSASDMSDIVVLSTLPSQEAARLQTGRTGSDQLSEVLACISWGSDSDDGDDAGAVNKADIVNVNAQDAVTQNKKGKEEKDKKKMNIDTKNVLEEEIPGKLKQKVVPMNTSTDSDIRIKKGKKCKNHDNLLLVEEEVLQRRISTPLIGRQTPSLLEQLKIVEKEVNSEEEMEDIKDGGAQEKNCHRNLITEIGEVTAHSEPLSCLPCLEKETKPQVAVKTITPTITTASVKAVKTITTAKTTVTSSVTTGAVAAAVPVNKSKKTKKRSKRDIKKPKEIKDDSGEDEKEETRRSEKEELQPIKPNSRQNDICTYKDEHLTGWSDSISKFAQPLFNNLAFDELSEYVGTRTPREQRIRARAAWEANPIDVMVEGELYENPIPVASASVTGVSTEDTGGDKSHPESKTNQNSENKRKKKVKHNSLKISDDSENSTKKSVTNMRAKKPACENKIPVSESRRDVSVVQSSRKNLAPAKLEACNLPDAEMKKLKKKYMKSQKVKAVKRVRRASSGRRQDQISAEFQYLFSVDLKSPTGKEEKEAGDLFKERAPRNSQEHYSPIIAIQDTSENGFPALPSQQNTIKIGLECDEQQNKPPSTEDDDFEVGDVEEKKDIGEENKEEQVEEDCEEGKGVDGKQLAPFVPSCVLDIMDALPPASVSRDGRDMLEWRRAALPMVPRHALPVFRSKYKAKYAKKHELRRMRLRRLSLSPHGGIMDRIRNQLAAPGSMDQVTKKWCKTSIAANPEPKVSVISSDQYSELATDEKPEQIPVVPPAPISYASVLKKTQDIKDLCTINIPTAEVQAASSGCSVPTPIYSLSGLEPEGACPAQACLCNDSKCANSQNKTEGVVARNFPKEFTNYTSGGKDSIDTTSRPSQLQLVPLSAHAQETGGVATFDKESGTTLNWPVPFFISETKIGSSTENCSKQTLGFDTPALHIRPTAKRLHVAPANSKRRRPQMSLQQNDELQLAEVSETEERGVLLDMALVSCLADNSQLRTTVVQLERDLRNLRIANMQLESQKQKDQKEHVQNQQAQRHRPSSTSRNTKEPREMHICKWAGKISKLVRSNVEVISLSAKVRDYEKEIASLNNQINSLKEALQLETKRRTRALTKWFKLKLKVKTLRSRLREQKQGDSLSTTDTTAEPEGSDAPKNHELCTHAEIIHVHKGEKEKNEWVDNWEPPCKRRKLDTDSETKSSCQSPKITLPPPPDAFVLPPPQCSRPQFQPPMPSIHIPPAYPQNQPLLPAAQGTLLTGRSHFGLEQPREPSRDLRPCQQSQQALAANAPFDKHSGTPIQHQSRPRANHVGATLTKVQYQGSPQHQSLRTSNIPGQINSGFCQRKKSPPHLPLPTPAQAPVYRPNLSPQAPIFPQFHALGGQPSPPGHILIQNRPTPITPPPPPCYQLAWPLPYPFVADPSSDGQTYEPPSLPPWNPPSPPCQSWNLCGNDRDTLYPPLFPQDQTIILPDFSKRPIFYDSKPQSAFSGLRENKSAQLFPGHDQRQAELFQRSPIGFPGPNPFLAPPMQAPASPPGRYRSDFMRRMMRGEAGKPRAPPNPYRLFHQTDPTTPREPRVDKCHPNLSPPVPAQHYGYDQGLNATSTWTRGLESPRVMQGRSPNACYRNTPAYVELTTDGLVEATRHELATASAASRTCDGNNSSNITIANNENSSRKQEKSNNMTTNNNNINENSKNYGTSSDSSIFRLIESRPACQIRSS